MNDVLDILSVHLHDPGFPGKTYVLAQDIGIDGLILVPVHQLSHVGHFYNLCISDKHIKELSYDQGVLNRVFFLKLLGNTSPVPHVIFIESDVDRFFPARFSHYFTNLVLNDPDTILGGDGGSHELIEIVA
jgi:hypothetical protein